MARLQRKSLSAPDETRSFTNVPGWDLVRRVGLDLEGEPVVHFDMEPAAEDHAEVVVLARRRPGKLEIFELDDVVIGRTIIEPGWRWSKDVKEIAGLVHRRGRLDEHARATR